MDTHFFGALAAAFIVIPLTIVRVALIWFPNRSVLVSNLGRVGFTWSLNQGIILTNRFSPAKDLAIYLGITAFKLFFYIYLSWIGMILALVDFYKLYGRYKFSYDSMMSFNKLKTELIEDEAKLMSLMGLAFERDFQKNPEEKQLYNSKVKSQLEKVKKSMNEILDDVNSKNTEGSKFPDAKMIKELLTLMPNNEIWAATVGSLARISPLTIWETHYLSNVFERQICDDTRGGYWILSSAIIRISVLRLSGIKFDMDIVEAAITEEELTYFEKYIGLDGECEARNTYLSMLKESPNNPDARSAIMLFILLTIVPDMEFPKAKFAQPTPAA